MENWDDNWSSSSDSEETGSSYSDESNSSLRMEAVRVGGKSFLFPQGLCDNAEVFKEFLSLDLWNSFSEQHKQHLRNLLPSFPEKDAEEKDATIRMLFNRENIRFGNPLVEFQKQLRAGHFRPDVSKMRALLRKVQYKDYKRNERWRMYKLVKSVLASRQRLVDAVINGEKPKVFPPSPKKPSVSLSPNVKSRYFQELGLIKEEIGESSESSEDENYPEGPLTGGVKKSRRSLSLMEMGLNEGIEPVLGTLCTGPTPWDQGKIPQYNPYSVPEQSYSSMLALHSKRRSNREDHPDLQTDGITLHEVAQRCSKFLKRPSGSKPVISKKSKVNKVNRAPSMSSPMVEDDHDDTSDTEETGSTMLKLDMDDEVEKVVDIEAVDDLPPLPIIVRQNSSINQTIKKLIYEDGPMNNEMQLPGILNTSVRERSHTVNSSPKSNKSLSIKRQRIESHEVYKKVANNIDETPKKVISSGEQKKAKVTVIKTEAEIPLPEIKKARVPLTPATLSDLDGIDMMDLPVDFDESSPLSLDEMKPHPELMQETQACFFSLIRDILLSTPDHRIEPRDLEARVKAWANCPIAPLNPWYTPQLESRLQSAVHFLAGDSSESLPEDYVPYMEWKVNAKAYQWIGAGRDSDHRLLSLCAMWGERGGSSTNNNSSSSLGIQTPSGPPPPRGPAVQPTSPQDRLIFRQQEKQRYETPFRAFTYRVGGVERVVGPVRSTQAGNLSKARGHSLLIDDRPKYVTILELVRDAVARLPNAQGTRADIVTLLKDSQYLSESAQEGMLSSVVSGALDKLHYEHDPSVKYDSKRKIWVYLHRGRSVEEFERLHALGANVKVSRPKSARKSAKPKKDNLPKIEIPENSTENRTTTTTEAGSILAITSSSSGSPLVVEAKAAPKRPVTTVTRKLIHEGGVKSLLGKPRSKLNEGLLRVQQQQNNTAQQKTGSILPARTIVQDTSLVRTQPQNVVKKSVTITADAVAKATAGKSIVKVITTSQASNQNAVRTVQRTATHSAQQQQQQQILQLKQQLLSSGDKIVKASTGQATALVKKQTQPQSQIQQQTQITQQAPQQQQVIVMKQQSTGEGTSGTSTVGSVPQQQMIVINQQQILVDSLSVKHQKQLQQILTKQQQVDQQPTANQSIQLILGKQQPGEQGKVVATTAKGTGPMIVVKPNDVTGKHGQGGVQQMILVKQSSASDGEQTTTHITQQQLQQMILLKQQQSQGQGQSGGQGQPVTQQMIIVKQPDQKSVQVIPQSATKTQTQPLTLAQLQQLQQQQQQQSQQHQRTSVTSLLTHPRVVAHVSTSGGTSLIKPQVTSGSNAGSSMVAKVVPGTGTNTPIITMESLLSATKHQQTQQATVRLPAVTRAVPSQYAVVSLPQQRVVQTTVAQVSGAGDVSSSTAQGVKMATAQGVRIPGLNLTQIAGKQVLLASKPAQAATIQGQNVVLGSSGGQALLVGSSGGQQGTLTLLQQGSQQILIPPSALKNLKVIPLAPGKNAQQGRQQVFARIINPGSVRPVITTNIVQDTNQQPPPSTSKD